MNATEIVLTDDGGRVIGIEGETVLVAYGSGGVQYFGTKAQFWSKSQQNQRALAAAKRMPRVSSHLWAKINAPTLNASRPIPTWEECIEYARSMESR